MQNNKLTTGILHLVILVIGIIIGRYLIPHQEQGAIPYYNNQNNQIHNQEENRDGKKEGIEDKSNALNTNEVSGDSDEGTTHTSGGGEKETMIVRVPRIGEGGAIQFDPVRVQKSPAVLNAVYRELFKIQSGDNSGAWNGLSFDSVSLDSGVAKVKFSGNWIPEGDMSGYVFRRLVDAAAFQYPNVNRVMVYINGNAFDWCIDDVSGGENGCPEKPRYWDDTRAYYANNLALTY